MNQKKALIDRILNQKLQGSSQTDASCKYCISCKGPSPDGGCEIKKCGGSDCKGDGCLAGCHQ